MDSNSMRFLPYKELIRNFGMAMFDTTYEPDMNPTRNKRVRVDCKRVLGQRPTLTQLRNGLGSD